MAIDYSKLVKLMERKGESFNSLKNKKVITDHAMRQLQNGLPTSLLYIDNICQHFGLPIEQVVEIIPEKE